VKLSLISYLLEEDGFNAAEFALVLPVLVLFIFGTIHLCLMMYTSSRLHWATEDAARCAVARPFTCTDADTVDSPTVLTWADNAYSGLAPATFSYSPTATCSNVNDTGAATNGRAVTGAATYSIVLPFFSQSFVLNATTCFPFYEI
jgi:Flp pilus assembly protein TadG